MLLESVVGEKKMKEVKNQIHLLNSEGSYQGKDKTIIKALEVFNQRSFVAMKNKMGQANADEKY
jgi:hypothetical protein